MKCVSASGCRASCRSGCASASANATPINQPMMLHLFNFQELSAICTLGVSDAQMRELAEERKGNPSFGLVGILRAVRRFER